MCRWLCSASTAYGNVNFFGGPSSTAVKASAKLKQLEEENEDAMFVFDVWLDSVEVLEKIQTMFSGPVTLQIRFSFLYNQFFRVNFSGIFFKTERIIAFKDSVIRCMYFSS